MVSTNNEFTLSPPQAIAGRDPPHRIDVNSIESSPSIVTIDDHDEEQSVISEYTQTHQEINTADIIFLPSGTDASVTFSHSHCREYSWSEAQRVED
jgi:hypothetical protein